MVVFAVLYIYPFRYMIYTHGFFRYLFAIPAMNYRTAQ
jgi:hypothetical protein